MDLLEKIQSLCDQKGITIYKLEQETDLTKGSIRKWETSSPSSEKLLKVAKYFNVSMESLIDGKDLQQSKTYLFIDKLFKVSSLNLMKWWVWDYDPERATYLEYEFYKKFDLYSFKEFKKGCDEYSSNNAFYTEYNKSSSYLLLKIHNIQKDSYKISFFIFCNGEINYYASDENISLLEDLFQLVKTKVLGIDDLIEQFLNDDFKADDDNGDFVEIEDGDPLPF
jgi:transcriptional regulator with XRE-family HTH domain